MRIVVSSEGDGTLDSKVSEHFGRCPRFAVVDVEDGSIRKVMSLENPFYASHTPGSVPSFIRKLEADVMIAGGMGRRAISMFRDTGIICSTGAAGTVRSAINSYLAGNMSDAAPCRESLDHSRASTDLSLNSPDDREGTRNER